MCLWIGNLAFDLVVISSFCIGKIGIIIGLCITKKFLSGWFIFLSLSKGQRFILLTKSWGWAELNSGTVFLTRTTGPTYRIWYLNCLHYNCENKWDQDFALGFYTNTFYLENGLTFFFFNSILKIYILLTYLEMTFMS